MSLLELAIKQAADRLSSNGERLALEKSTPEAATEKVRRL